MKATVVIALILYLLSISLVSGFKLSIPDEHNKHFVAIRMSASLLPTLPRAHAMMLGKRILQLSTVSLSSMALERKIPEYFSVIDAPTLSFFISAALSLLPSMQLDPDISSILQLAAWQLFLQASLILSIFSSPRMVSLTGDRFEGEQRKKNLLLPTLIAFILAAGGSFLGGYFSYALLQNPKFTSLPFMKITGSLKSTLVPTTSSLTASYIGGTANYFEVADLLSHLGETPNVINAIDIGIMVLFFCVLNIIKSSSFFSRLLPRSNRLNVEKRPELRPRLYIEPSPSDPNYWKHQAVKASRIFKLIAGALLVTKFIVVICKKLPYRGLSVMLTAGAGLYMNSKKPEKITAFFEEFEVLGNVGSLYLLCMFYSVIGLNSGLSEFPLVGTPLLVLISTILSVHLLVLLVGSKLVNMLLSKQNGDSVFPIDIDSAVIASNAAVGGAATAASYASLIGRQDLVVSASVVGLLGYSIGTPLGLYLAKIFTR